MPEAAALLARLDAAIRELLELRAAVAGANTLHNVDGIDTPTDDDLAPDNLLDTHAAQERFGYPQDTIRKWCRREGLGVMRGGRWLVSVPRLQARIRK